MAKSNVYQVSQSKVKIYRKCRRAYHNRYVLKLRKRIKGRPLQFGSLVHTMLEADANGANPYKALTAEVKGQKLFNVEREELEGIATDVRWIMREYFEFWEQAGKDKELHFLKRDKKSAEHEIILDLATGITVVVKLDAVASNKRGNWLVEHKTFKNMPSDDHRWRDLQGNLYKWAIDEVGIKVDGMCWDYIRSKPPSTPQLLKDGSVSAKRLDTLPGVLLDFGKEQKVKIPPRLLKTAEDNRSKYFTRTFTAFRSQTVKLLHADFVETAQEMARNHGNSKAMSIDRHCEWCEYEPLCRAELTGGDTKFIIKKEYTTSEQREKQEIEAVG